MDNNEQTNVVRIKNFVEKIEFLIRRLRLPLFCDSRSEIVLTDSEIHNIAEIVFLKLDTTLALGYETHGTLVKIINEALTDKEKNIFERQLNDEKCPHRLKIAENLARIDGIVQNNEFLQKVRKEAGDKEKVGEINYHIPALGVSASSNNMVIYISDYGIMYDEKHPEKVKVGLKSGDYALKSQAKLNEQLLSQTQAKAAAALEEVE